MIIAIGVLIPSAAMAGKLPPNDPPTVANASGDPAYPGDPGDPAYPGDPGATDSSELAFTGDYTLELAFVGFAIVGLGVVLLRLGRRPARV